MMDGTSIQVVRADGVVAHETILSPDVPEEWIVNAVDRALREVVADFKRARGEGCWACAEKRHDPSTHMDWDQKQTSEQRPWMADHIEFAHEREIAGEHDVMELHRMHTRMHEVSEWDHGQYNYPGAVRP
jgi:hypothetical protein